MQIKGKNAYSNLYITLEGIGDDATIRGFGFLLRNAANVELRNFAIMRCMDDCVSLDTDNKYIWVHNLDLFYGQKGSDADQVKGDGTTDVKGDSQYITFAYNHYFGYKGEASDRPETGYPMYIFLHGSGEKDEEFALAYNLCRKFEDAPSVYFIPQIPKLFI